MSLNRDPHGPPLTCVAACSGGECDDDSDDECDNILEDLENIDDELDETGIVFVTTEDTGFAKKNGVKKFPSLVFFRNKEPLLYTGTYGAQHTPIVVASVTLVVTQLLFQKYEGAQSFDMLRKWRGEEAHVLRF